VLSQKGIHQQQDNIEGKIKIKTIYFSYIISLSGALHQTCTRKLAVKKYLKK
jgi:hypothetical protein